MLIGSSCLTLLHRDVLFYSRMLEWTSIDTWNVPNRHRDSDSDRIPRGCSTALIDSDGRRRSLNLLRPLTSEPVVSQRHIFLLRESGLINQNGRIYWANIVILVRIKYVRLLHERLQSSVCQLSFFSSWGRRSEVLLSTGDHERLSTSCLS